MFGGQSGLLSALDFFRPDHLVFATDAPLGPIGEFAAALDRLALSGAERHEIIPRSPASPADGPPVPSTTRGAAATTASPRRSGRPMCWSRGSTSGCRSSAGTRPSSASSGPVDQGGAERPDGDPAPSGMTLWPRNRLPIGDGYRRSTQREITSAAAPAKMIARTTASTLRAS